MSTFDRLSRNEQMRAYVDCWPYPWKSQRRLTAKQNAQLTVDLETWAERYFAARKPEPTPAEIERQRLNSEIANAATELAKRTGNAFFADLAALYRAKAPRNHRAIMTALGIVPVEFGVN